MLLFDKIAGLIRHDILCTSKTYAANFFFACLPSCSHTDWCLHCAGVGTRYWEQRTFAISWSIRYIDKFLILNTLLFCIGGHPGLVFGTLNCFVHIIMYGYYFGSVFNPKLKANLMIKRSITQLQIVSKYPRFYSTIFPIHANKNKNRSSSTSSLDSVRACHNPFECSVLCNRLQLSKSFADDCHFTKFHNVIIIFRLLLPCLCAAKTIESQGQLMFHVSWITKKNNKIQIQYICK